MQGGRCQGTHKNRNKVQAQIEPVQTLGHKGVVTDRVRGLSAHKVTDRVEGLSAHKVIDRVEGLSAHKVTDGYPRFLSKRSSKAQHFLPINPFKQFN